MRVRTIILTIALLMTTLVGACAGGLRGFVTSSPSDQDPADSTPSSAPTKPTGAGVEGPVYIDRTELNVMESFPIQLSVLVQGNLPTPCHQLKYSVSAADEQGNIDVEIWSEILLGQDCIQVLEPFEETIPLGNVENGTFTVFVNGEEVGQVDA